MTNFTLRKTTLFLFILLVSNLIQAQVEDLSFTVSPTVDYVWWDDNTGLADGALYGGTLGFGFGEFLELRGVFQTSGNLTTDFSSYGLNTYSEEIFESQTVDLNRYGGELKVNFSKTDFSPYLTIGTGIQSLKLENRESFEQIYASAGLGLRLALTDRLNVLIEGRGLGFNINAPNNLLTPSNQEAFNVNTSNLSRDQALNFSAMAGLQVYLGGRKPGELSSLDRAYLNNYKGGFEGWTWVIEPSVAYLNFDANSLYKDTWMAGAYAGLDFTRYIGVRGFYFQGTDKALGLDGFDRLNMYGLEFRAKLNDGRGVNPFLILGGGYLNPQSGYEGTLPPAGAQSTAFANAGLGLDIPLGQTILLTGGARAMVTSSQDISNLAGPSDLQSHVMFTAGVKIQLGKKLNAEDNAILMREQARLNEDPASANSEEYKRLQELKSSYQQELKELDQAYEKAYQNNNTKKAVEALEEKKRVNSSLKEIEKLEKLYKSSENQDSGQYLKMTPEEFESLIDRILKGIDEKYEKNTARSSEKAKPENAMMLNLFKRIESLEKEKLQAEQKTDQKVSRVENTTSSEDDTALDGSEVKKQEETIQLLEENTEQQKQMLKTLEQKAKQQEAIQKEIKTKTKEQKRLEKEIQQKIKEQEKLQKALDEKAKEQQDSRRQKEQELKKAQEEIKRLEEEAKEKTKDSID